MRFQPKTDPIIQKPIFVSKNGSVPLKTDPFPPKTVVLDPISRGFFRQMIWVLLFMKGLSLLDDSTVNHDAFSAMVRVTRHIHFVMLESN